MPLLRKGILLPVEGIDYSKPAAFIGPRAGFPKNLRVIKGEYCKRPGKTLYGADACAGGQIMGLGVLDLPTIKYLIRGSKTKLQVYNTTTLVWNDVTATPFSGGDEDFFSFANVTESQIVVATNGYDAIRKWAGTGNFSILGGSPGKAKYAAYVTPYLLLAHLDEGAAILPWKVKWCDTDAPEVWAGGNAGSSLLTSEPSPLQNIKRLNEFCAAYKENSLWLGYKVDPPDIFRFSCVVTGKGLGSPRALAETEGAHFFMGFNDFYQWNGAGLPISIGAPVRDRVFATLDRSKIKRCFALHIENLHEIWFYIVVSGGTWPTEVWKYDYRTGYWYFDTCDSLTAAITWKKISTQAWDDDTGGWDEALDVWDSGDSILDWEEIIFGNSGGYTSRLDYNTTNDLGLAVLGQYETGDFTADVFEFNKRWLQLDVWARDYNSARLYVDYSTDEGDTWTNIPYSANQAYIELGQKIQVYRMYFDIVSPTIRFRFRNAEISGQFYLRNFYPYYLAREEAKA